MNVTILRMANASRSPGYREWRIAGHRFAVEPGHMTLWNVRGLTGIAKGLRLPW